jgi:hypothetical protein
LARRRAKKAKPAKPAPQKSASDTKLAVAILVFGMATALSAIYKLGSQITILLGLVTAAAALAIALKNK